MENIIKINDTTLGVVPPATEYTKDFIDSKVEEYNLSIINLQTERQKWIDLQNKENEFNLVSEL